MARGNINDLPQVPSEAKFGDYVTIKEAAEILDVHPQVARKYIRPTAAVNGDTIPAKLTGYRWANMILVPFAEVEELAGDEEERARRAARKAKMAERRKTRRAKTEELANVVGMDPELVEAIRKGDTAKVAELLGT